MHILVVEDEHRMRELLRQGLTEDGHASPWRTTVTKAQPRQGSAFDLIVLDVMLPGPDGFAIARQLRKQRNRTPILMLTARDATRDIVEGLNLGADDYLTSPSHSRCCSPACGGGPPWSHPSAVWLQVADLTMNQGTREVRRGDRPIELTRTSTHSRAADAQCRPCDLARALARNRLGRLDVEANTLDVFVRLLRTKVEAEGKSNSFRPCGGGYSVRADGA